MKLQNEIYNLLLISKTETFFWLHFKFHIVYNLAIQFGFVIISGFGGYFIGAFQSGTSFVYQSDNSPIVYFAPYCTGGVGLPGSFAPCPAGQTCCALVNDFPGQGPCWWTSGPTCAVAQNYVCEYEYEGKYI